MKINDLIKTYPRKRKKLNAEYNKIYKKFYNNHLNKKNIISFIIKNAEKLFHKLTYEAKPKNINILELGAGNLDHVKYENFFRYDVVEPEKRYYIKNKKALKKVNKIYRSIFSIPNNKSYDKIIAIATLDVIDNLPKFLSKIGVLMNKNSILCVGNSTIGSLSFYLTWRFTSGLYFFFKYRKNLRVLKDHESVNKFNEIVSLLKYFYKSVEIKMIPNLFYLYKPTCFIKVKEPDLKKCKRYLK